MTAIGEALQRLEQDRGIRLEQLRMNPDFIDTVLVATQAALRTSRETKRCALLNAVVNTAVSPNLDMSRRQMFLYMIDSFTDLHLLLLGILHEPSAWLAKHNLDPRPLYGSSTFFGALVDAGLLEPGPYSTKSSLYQQVCRDLFACGLVDTDTLGVSVVEEKTVKSRTTPLGREFLEFIRAPVIDTSQRAG